MILCVLGLLTAAIVIGIASKNSSMNPYYNLLCLLSNIYFNLDGGFHKKINVDAIMSHLKKFEEAAVANK